ncbi:hypothetical protein RUM43_007602 [Polyplax serrata]|uniref:Transmembrane protein 169 n=1 Tax=Polyplax serrata TaxID=468196 RepID=A0AAN8S5M1_POLSC
MPGVNNLPDSITIKTNDAGGIGDFGSTEDFEDDITETTALKQNTDISINNFMTLSGTIQRGKQRGEYVNVVLNMSREELERLESDLLKKKEFPCGAKPGVGIHIFLWSVICLPISFLMSTVYSFCIGTLTWYSIFSHFSEAKSFTMKILVPPLLIMLYPFLIILASIGLGVYAGIKQLSCYWTIWFAEFVDYEKGFYGWLCNTLDIPDCAPYEVVVLSRLQKA